jgi:hypothetical protein
MALTEEQLKQMLSMRDKDLVREAGDRAYLVESNRRLKRSTERLTWVLIILTVILVILTAPLAIDEVLKLR